MNLESKFLFISRFFIILFIIINLSYLIPLDIFEVEFYTKVSTTIVDTATLLILGLAFPKLIFLKNIQNLKKFDEADSQLRLEVIERKNFYNSKIAFFISIFFLIVSLIQPINIIFTLNKNDVYSSAIIQSFNNKLNVENQIIEKESSLINKDMTNEKKFSEIEKKKNNLKNINQRNIEFFIEKNNKAIFNQIKLIVRNLIMALIWMIVFYKLSII